MNDSFFEELSRILAEQDIETAPPTSGRLRILLNGQPVCRVQADGMLCLTPCDLTTPEAGALRHKVAPIAETVCEYTSLVEIAPLLKSDSNNDDYRLLADFNGVILAGKETSHGYQFVTWRRDAMGGGYELGAYFGDNYPAAKESFVRRSGLISSNRLLSDAQLTELYLCTQDTLDDNYALTDQQTELLTKTAGQIRSAVPDLQERVEQARWESPEKQIQKFNM